MYLRDFGPEKSWNSQSVMVQAQSMFQIVSMQNAIHLNQVTLERALHRSYFNMQAFKPLGQPLLATGKTYAQDGTACQGLSRRHGLAASNAVPACRTHGVKSANGQHSPSSGQYGVLQAISYYYQQIERFFLVVTRLSMVEPRLAHLAVLEGTTSHITLPLSFGESRYGGGLD